MARVTIGKLVSPEQYRVEANQGEDQGTSQTQKPRGGTMHHGGRLLRGFGIWGRRSVGSVQNAGPHFISIALPGIGSRLDGIQFGQWRSAVSPVRFDPGHKPSPIGGLASAPPRSWRHDHQGTFAHEMIQDAGAEAGSRPFLSVVVAARNEARSLPQLIEEVVRVLRPLCQRPALPIRRRPADSRSSLWMTARPIQPRRSSRIFRDHS